ncbi:MAG: response regulator [bacterium]|nr:response regulator [bacterium]
MLDKILFVDDEPDFERLIRQKYRRMLRRGLIDFEFASNGREALRKLREEENVSLVMTDINMPEMDGLTLLEEIAKLNKHLLVVIISAYGDMDNIRTAMNRGAFDFLTKPINFEDMEITRQKALDEVLKIRERLRLQEEKLELEERNRFVQDTFGRYLSGAVVQTLLDSPDGLKLGGEKREVSILLSDLRGFSAHVERCPPEQIVATLNHYLSTMIDFILEYGGIIDEIIGDAILAIFGAPLSRDDDTERAVACAAAMQLAMESVNERNARNGWPILEMGIGIDSGEVVVGNIGSKKRAKYGVVGRHVNLAARIETCTVGGQILVSESTWQKCGPILDIGEEIQFVAKGFEDPVKAYDVCGVHGRHDLHLPHRGLSLVDLDEPVTVQVVLLGEARSSGLVQTGDLIALSPRGAIVQTASPMETFSTVKLQLAQTDEAESGHDLYAKVIRRDKEREDCFVVCFTSVPPEAEEILTALLEQKASVH